MYNNKQLKPIETKFKGYKFRSRLEAKWAVFFEGMKLNWIYEPEGFQLPSGVCYLPDFFVKSPENCFDYYYEVKPKGTKHCSKVKEFNQCLNTLLEINGAWTYQNGDKPKKIIQLNGDPIDFVRGVCPRCKQISNDNPLFDQDQDNFVSEYTCEECDHTKPGWGEFIETTNDGKEFYWLKGTMINLDQDVIADLASDIALISCESREYRFDGNLNFKSCTKSKPCPICKKYDQCLISFSYADGEYVCCFREINFVVGWVALKFQFSNDGRGYTIYKRNSHV